MSSEPSFCPPDTLPVLFAYIDREERDHFTRETPVRWYEQACADLLGRSLRDVFGEAGHAAIRYLVARALAGERVSFTGSLPDRHLGERFASVTFIPHRNAAGEIIGCFSIVENVGDLRQHEAALPTVSALTPGRTPEQENESARLMRVRTLGDMTAALAHEITQPLSATLAYIQGSLRLMRADERISPDLIDHMEKAAAQARRVGDIIGHIRRFVRRDKPTRSDVDIADAIHRTVALVAGDAEAEHISLSLDIAPDLPTVAIERIALEQVILNLLHNSIEALAGTPATERRICIATSQPRPDAIEVSVSDNGPGLAANVEDRLFQPFVTTKPGGVGLGLAICLTIVREHGGDLWLEHRGETGTTFSFLLPTGEGPADDVS